MKDTLGTIFGFIIGSALVVFGIIFPDHLSNYYVYQTTAYEQIIEQMELERRPRVEIRKVRHEMEEFKNSLIGMISRFVDLKSLGIVAGGSFAATLIAFPFSKAVRVAVFMAEALGTGTMQEEFLDVYETVLRLAEKRTNNEVITDSDIEAIKNEQLRDWVQDFISVDVVTEDMISEIIESEIEMYNYRAFEEIDVLKFLGSASPAFGMVGTVVGLILMLAAAAGSNAKISDIMGSMSVALITTLYGVLAAQLIFIPLASKRYQLKESNVKLMEMMQEGILYLKRREIVDAISQDLIIYLPTKMRRMVTAEKMAALQSGDLGL